MNKQVEVKQNGYKDCGPSCLLSIIKYYGGDISKEELSLILNTDKNGTTAYNLIHGAKSLGFDGYGIKYSFEEIVSNNIEFPIIAHTLIDNLYHYIVIYKVDVNKKILFAMNPSVGNIKIKFDYFRTIYLGNSIVLYPIKKIPTIENSKSIYKYLIEYIFNNKSKLIIFYILSLLVILLSIITSYYLKLIIDNILPKYLLSNLLFVSYIILDIYFVKSLLSFIRNKYLIDIIYNVGIKINNSTIRHIFNLPYQFFKNKSTGEIISRVVDIKNFKEIISNLIVNLSIDASLIIMSMISLLIINYKLFLIVLIFTLLYLLTTIFYSKSISEDINDFQIKNSDYNKSLTESIEGYETNKNINMINSVCKILEIKYIIYSKKYVKYQNTINRQTYFKDIIMDICYLVVIFYGTILISNNIISLGTFMLFNSLISYFIEPIKNILDLFPNYSYLKNIYTRINDLILIKSPSNTESDYKIKGDIVFKNVNYSYNSIDKVINNINLKIKYGSKFLIYGKSGIGKSTIIKILLKYNKEYEGSIFINNYNLLDIDESIISASFTYVSQLSYINNNTLKNNIIYDRNISDKDYENVINICHVNKLRDSKKLRDNFMIEDNGFNISGGERQKVILARALLKKSNYIILDEALSEVEFIEEKEILKKIIHYYKDKTIIYISHKSEIIDLFNDKYCLERR